MKKTRRNETTTLATLVENASAIIRDMRVIQKTLKDSPSVEEFVAWSVSTLFNYGEEIAAEASRLQSLLLTDKTLKF